MFYRCNPFKNRMCGKKKCYVNGGSCSLTTIAKYSIDGKPLTVENDGHIVTREQERIKKRILGKAKSDEKEEKA